MHNLYFIAIIPPPDICEEITEIKLEIADRFGSRHALNAPPHITLHMPFKWKEKKIEQLNDLIQQVNDEMKPFEIQLRNFDFFEPRVVFIDVVPNEQLNNLQYDVVRLCQRKLKLDNANYRDQPFHPHVTVAFRDLRRTAFYEAKKHYENLEIDFQFQIKEICLLKHEGKQWIKKPIN